MMTEYQRRKEAARDMAIYWQSTFDQHNYSWAELAAWQDHFQHLAEKYGLIEEFRENGIL